MESNNYVYIRSLRNENDQHKVMVSRFVGAMTEIVVFREKWEMSDYARTFAGLVVYLRHHSDNDISQFGEFVSPFVVENCELGDGESFTRDELLDQFLREDARLWWATELLRFAPDTPACLRVSSYDKHEWVATVDTPLLAVLADRGFRL